MSQRQRKTKNEVISIDCESDNELGTTGGSKSEDDPSPPTHTIIVNSDSEDESNDAKRVKSFVNEKPFVNVSNCKPVLLCRAVPFFVTSNFIVSVSALECNKTDYL